MINQKYVNLLNKSFERIKDIDVIYKSEEYENDRTDKNKFSPSQVKSEAKPSGTSKIDTKTKQSTRKCHPKPHALKHFSPEEDIILLEAINKGGFISFTKLGHKLNRERASVRSRIFKLQRTNRTTREYKISTQIYIFCTLVCKRKKT